MGDPGVFWMCPSDLVATIYTDIQRWGSTENPKVVARCLVPRRRFPFNATHRIFPFNRTHRIYRWICRTVAQACWRPEGHQPRNETYRLALPLVMGQSLRTF